MPSSTTVPQVMEQLESWGTESMRQHHLHSGSGENVFGVLLGKLRPFAEGIGKNHALALGLWETGNVDARILACMVMDPAAVTEKEAQALVASLSYVYILDELVGRVLVHAPCAAALRTKWMESNAELQRRAGWKLLTGQIARGRHEGLDIDGILTRVERDLPDAPYRVKEGMNHALVEIGIKLPAYREQALAIGERLGHWDPRPIPKGCTSSYAPEWISVILAKKDGEWKIRAAKAVATRMAKAAELAKGGEKAVTKPAVAKKTAAKKAAPKKAAAKPVAKKKSVVKKAAPKKKVARRAK